MNKQARSYWLSLLLWIWIPILGWIDLRKTLGTAEAMTIAAAILAGLGLLLLLEWLLAKRRTERWMSRYHLCLAAGFGVATAFLVFFALQ